MDLDDVVVKTAWGAGRIFNVDVVNAEAKAVVARVTVSVPANWPENLADLVTGKSVREEVEQMAFSFATYAASAVGESPTEATSKRSAKSTGKPKKR